MSKSLRLPIFPVMGKSLVLILKLTFWTLKSQYVKNIPISLCQKLGKAPHFNTIFDGSSQVLVIFTPFLREKSRFRSTTKDYPAQPSSLAQFKCRNGELPIHRQCTKNLYDQWPQTQRRVGDEFPRTYGSHSDFLIQWWLMINDNWWLGLVSYTHWSSIDTSKMGYLSFRYTPFCPNISLGCSPEPNWGLTIIGCSDLTTRSILKWQNLGKLDMGRHWVYQIVQTLTSSSAPGTKGTYCLPCSIESPARLPMVLRLLAVLAHTLHRKMTLSSISKNLLVVLLPPKRNSP